MKSVRGLLVLLILPPATAWSADQRVSMYQDKPRSYIAANLVQGALDFDNRDDTVNPAALSVRMGGMASDHLGLEVRLGTGVGTTTERGTAGNTRTKVDYSLDHLGGVYLTARAPLLDVPRVGKVYTQGYLGLGTEQFKTETRVCNDTSCKSDTERFDESGPSWGAALGVRPWPEISLAVEYMRYVSKDEIEVSGLEAGILYHF